MPLSQSRILMPAGRRPHLVVVGALLLASCRAPHPVATTPSPVTPVAAAAPAAGAREDSVRRDPVVFADGWRFAKNAPATFAEHGMVASNAPLASAAGAEVMRLGGNAVDAAVATGFALAVVWPEAGNIGGGGYMVIQMADGRREVVDYREVAPLAASRDMYLKPDGTTDGSIIGWRSSGVPGAVAGLLAAHAKYGRLPRAQVMAPAIRMARDGFVVDSGLNTSITRSRALLSRFAGKAVFLPNDSVPAIGSTFRQPALARTLDAIARGGADVYYHGWIADSIAAEEQRGGGIITKADLAGYTPRWREPLVWTYRQYTLVGMPPSSSGGVTMAETMNILEQQPRLPAFGSVAYLHLMGEAYQRAFIDRNSKLADPDFFPVPVAQLTSKDYAKRLYAQINLQRATPTPETTAQMAEGIHTTHYSVVDGDGSAVATTTTLNNSWGSGVYLPSVGFMMNDEMDDFAVQPGKPNMFGLVQGEANAIQPGKRMLSAMSPTVVLDAEGKVQMVAGAAGGPRIISATSQVILNVIEYGMSLADAMRAPRLHNQALPDEMRLETNGFPAATIDSLRAMGHAVNFLGGIANVNAIRRVPGGWHGVSEPRAFGAATGY